MQEPQAAHALWVANCCAVVPPATAEKPWIQAPSARGVPPLPLTMKALRPRPPPRSLRQLRKLAPPKTRKASLPTPPLPARLASVEIQALTSSHQSAAGGSCANTSTVINACKNVCVNCMKGTKSGQINQLKRVRFRTWPNCTQPGTSC